MLSEDFQFITNNIENNYPGFSIAIRENGRPAYDKLKYEMEQWIGHNVDIEVSQFLSKLKTYLLFFKDKHLRAYDSAKIDEKKYYEDLVINKNPRITLFEKAICLLELPSFNMRLWKKLDSVYDILPRIIKYKHLIIDLRNNSGGGERMYKQLLRILIKRKHYHTVLLVNRNCASATEVFIFKASKIKNVSSIGEPTSGQMAYGDIRKYITPNLKINVIIPTTVNMQFLPFEYIGLEPDELIDAEAGLERAIVYLNSI